MRKSLAALALVMAALAIGEGCAPVPLPHYAAYGPKRVEELLVDGGRHAHDHQCGDAVVVPAHGLDGDDGVDRVGAPGPEREHRGGLPAAAGSVEQPGQRRAGRRRRGDQVAQVGTEQGLTGRGEELQRSPVMLDDPPRLIDSEDQRPRGGVGKQGSDLCTIPDPDAAARVTAQARAPPQGAARRPGRPRACR